MTPAEKARLNGQIGVLREVALDYPGKTIENIIQQMEARAKEDRKSSYKILLTEYLENRFKSFAGTVNQIAEKYVLFHLLETIGNLHSNETILAKLNMMVDSGKKAREYSMRLGNGIPACIGDYDTEDKIGRECLDYLRKEGE